MYSTIVVGYDASETSAAALKEASHRVRNRNGKLYLVHAVFFDKEEFADLPSQREKRFEAGRHVCMQAKEEVAEQYQLDGSVDSLVCEGEPADVLIDVAEGKNADLIALGTYGRRGLKRLLMGSVTAEVILNSPCDVLVVKRPCSDCTGSYRSILVPFDGSDYSGKAMARAVEMAKTEGAKLTVLYVIPRYEEMVEFYRSESIRNSLRAEAEKVIAQARKIADAAKIEVRTEIREGHASDEIVAAADANGNDLIAMGTYGWKGVSKAIMGSTTNRVISHASCPILVVK